MIRRGKQNLFPSSNKVGVILKNYILKKLIIIPFTLLASILLIYILVNLSPVDPIALIVGDGGTEESIAALRAELGVDDPIIVQYGRYIWNLLHGSMGRSWFTNADVWNEIKNCIPVTFALALIVAVISIVIGTVLGVLCAVKQYSWIDTLVNLVSMFCSSMPPFWIGLMLLLWFALELDWFPAYGLDTWRHWVLPVVTMCIPQVTRFCRFTRSSMLDCIRADYITTARAKGNKESTVIFKEALRNALIPLITIAGTSIAQMMGGSVVIEQVFAIPGLGRLVISSIQKMDVPIVIGCIVVIAMVFLVITVIMDLLYAVVDPRIKAKFSSSRSILPRRKQVVLVEDEDDE